MHKNIRRLGPVPQWYVEQYRTTLDQWGHKDEEMFTNIQKINLRGKVIVGEALIMREIRRSFTTYGEQQAALKTQQGVNALRRTPPLFSAVELKVHEIMAKKPNEKIK